MTGFYRTNKKYPANLSLKLFFDGEVEKSNKFNILKSLVSAEQK